MCVFACVCEETREDDVFLVCYDDLCNEVIMLHITPQLLSESQIEMKRVVVSILFPM